MTQLLLIMLGGGIGAVIRGFITNLCTQRFNSDLPIATPIVNISGSFLIGLIMGMMLNVDWIQSFVVIGILGGLTTFSTLSSELVKLLIDDKKIISFIIYSVIQYGASFLACFVGYTLF
ncbi:MULTISPECIES: fluoride efflux transporter FluC [Staphylococcus]|uniref:fluoride efflux transporter FluC n=1 Tax=Staphylococcus TaxID=1279 RepID=UPI00062BB50B|nr:MULTISPECIES: CrcB family protein [Staphylococcus]MDH9160899.1 CrcB family protein [Staphylococcus succinus]MEB8124906.1 CrcB family protein [Staphylococcus succinus]OIJ29803.1 camphor resistance protein CrcB [Staphylococcus sp. LCT-H4]PNZ16981.1 CrcB family protein [Staphylococcus succinus subsp. succinus]RIN23788.1 CrcB family protein [Staphylococcus succinus]